MTCFGGTKHQHGAAVRSCRAKHQQPSTPKPLSQVQSTSEIHVAVKPTASCPQQAHARQKSMLVLTATSIPVPKLQRTAPSTHPATACTETATLLVCGQRECMQPHNKPVGRCVCMCACMHAYESVRAACEVRTATLQGKRAKRAHHHHGPSAPPPRVGA